VRDVIFITTVPIARIGAFTIKLRDGYALQSGNYQAGVQGWIIRDDGSAEFNNVTVRGAVYASSGSLANLTVLGLLSVGAAAPQIQIDGANKWVQSSNYSAGSAGFRLNADGSAEFNNVTMRGVVYANSGSLGNLTVSGTLTVNPGAILAGQGAITINNDGIAIATGPEDFLQSWKTIRWVTGTQTSVWIGGAISSGFNYTSGVIRAVSPDGTGYGSIGVIGANTGLAMPSAVYISAVVGSIYNLIRLEHTGYTLIQGPNSNWPPYAIFRTWPTNDDLTIRSNNRHLFCIGRVAGHLTGNVYWNGTNWNNFDTNAYGIIAASAANVGYFGVWVTTPGVNPRTPIELARLAWHVGGQTAHILRATNGTYASDWPAGWYGGLNTQDISCSGIYYNGLVQRSDPRLKANIRPIADRLLEKLARLEPVEFEWRDRPGRTYRGLTADQVAAVLPELCEHDADGNPVGYSLSELVVCLVKAVKELKAELDALKGGR
jgi:hypothetical protein